VRRVEDGCTGSKAGWQDETELPRSGTELFGVEHPIGEFLLRIALDGVAACPNAVASLWVLRQTLQG
jgi:hypothetical protein